MLKVVVTGGCGFLGSHVCKEFRRHGWATVAYDNLTKFEYDRADFNSSAIRNLQARTLQDSGTQLIVADILNMDEIDEAARGASLIVNCAAQPAMTVSMSHPRYDFEVNAKGLLNLLIAARARNIPVVHCSTIHVYGNDINYLVRDVGEDFFCYPDGPIDETEPILRGFVSPLHASKIAGEAYVQAFADTYSVPTAVFRLTGLYGPGQFGGEDHGWVANFAIRAMMHQPIKVFGTDLQVRDMLYVEDAARAFYTWYNEGCPQGTYNICGGPTHAVSIKQVLTLLADQFGHDQPPTIEPERIGDLWWFVGNYEKAWQAFGWEPHIPFVEGLHRLTDWLTENKYVFESVA
jgi:CDP-paratose 2-epimerase